MEFSFVFFGDFTFTCILPANYLLAASLVRAESVLTQVLSMVPVFSRDLVTCRITRSYAILSDWYLRAVSKFWKWYLSEILPSKKLQTNTCLNSDLCHGWVTFILLWADLDIISKVVQIHYLTLVFMWNQLVWKCLYRNIILYGIALTRIPTI